MGAGGFLALMPVVGVLGACVQVVGHVTLAAEDLPRLSRDLIQYVSEVTSHHPLPSFALWSGAPAAAAARCRILQCI